MNNDKLIALVAELERRAQNYNTDAKYADSEYWYGYNIGNAASYRYAAELLAAVIED